TVHLEVLEPPYPLLDAPGQEGPDHGVIVVERVRGGAIPHPVKPEVLVGGLQRGLLDLRRGSADHRQDWPHVAHGAYLRCGRPAPTPLGTRISNGVPTPPPRIPISVPSAPHRVQTGRLGPPTMGLWFGE